MLYSVGVVVIPGSFDVDAGILLMVVLIVAIGFGLGWIVRGRPRYRYGPVMRAGGFAPHQPTPVRRPGARRVVASDGDHDAMATASGGTGTPRARVFILCPCTNWMPFAQTRGSPRRRTPRAPPTRALVMPWSFGPPLRYESR